MSNAKHDQNHVATITAALNSDGATVIPIRVNPSTNALKTVDAATGSNNGPTNALHDGNFATSLIGVSSVDLITPVVAYADSSGNLLIDSN